MSRRQPQRNSTVSLPAACRSCGCTDNDCRQCIKKTGFACHWVEKDLCSACADNR
jgi:hypothetical protein